jgi:hypothetical protein
MHYGMADGCSLRCAVTCFLKAHWTRQQSSTLAGERFVPESPNLFWPQDHAWCVASEIDLPFTLVAGSNALAEHLMGHAMLEAEQAFADDPVDADSDDQNHDGP